MILYVYDYYVGIYSFNKINLLLDGLDDFMNSGKFNIVTEREIPNLEGKEITNLNEEFVRLFEPGLLCASESICNSLKEHRKYGFEYGDFIFFFAPQANENLVGHIICDFKNNNIRLWLYKNEAIRYLDKMLTIKPVLP